nr:hypothetical protein HK105_001534 [Polyrhizophydium stewartii]
MAAGAALLPAAAAANSTLSKDTGNCITGRITFDSTRIAPLYGNTDVATRARIDVSKYDMVLDQGTAQFMPTRGSALRLKKGSDGAGIATILSTTRYMLYGRFTARLKASTIPGVVTTFITMSERGDEIDWEIVGGNTGRAESNVFYKGIAERGIHGGKHDVSSPNGVGDFHEYTIDWKPDVLTFAIDGEVVRVHNKNGPEAVSAMTPPGERWFPSTPSLVQVSVWDGGSVAGGVSTWAGGPINWGNNSILNATVDYIDIYCYDNTGSLVPKWPADNVTNPVRAASAGITQAPSAWAPLAALATAAVASGIAALL